MRFVNGSKSQTKMKKVTSRLEIIYLQSDLSTLRTQTQSPLCKTP